MKKVFFAIAIVAIAFVSCSKDTELTSNKQDGKVSESVLNKIYNMGFSKQSVVKTEEGTYLVEGCIEFTEDQLNQAPKHNILRVGDNEQYHTTYLVTGLPRVITVSVNSKLGSQYVAAVDAAIARYNALGLQITFQRVASNGNIDLVVGRGSYLASGGFPTSTGNPYNQIKMNTTYLNSYSAPTLASIVAHEIGHCIGMRHTDYMDRSFSCGGAYTNEGASTVGAIYIPGTSANAENGSWMLACISNGVDRPFTNNDKTALTYMY